MPSATQPFLHCYTCLLNSCSTIVSDMKKEFIMALDRSVLSKKVKNFTLNFGPQLGSYGVLRLVLEMNEVVC